MSAGPTIRDVARLARVGIGTASRALNGHRSVSAEVRLRVRRAVEKLHYEPDQIAQSMRFGVTRTIACAIRDISIPGLGSNVKAAEEVLGEHGYTLLLAATGQRRERELELLRIFVQRRVDGIIIATSSEEDAEISQRLDQLKVPVVLMDRDDPPSLDAIIIDHRSGTRAGTRHLLELGHSRIALLTAEPTTRPARERISGFTEALRKSPMAKRQATMRFGDFSAEFAFRETSSLLSSQPRPTAIIAGGMATLAGVLRAIQARRLKIPRDISVVAGAETDLAELAAPPITVIRWNEADVGRLAAQLLIDRLNGERSDAPRRIVLPTEFIIRGSCGPPFDR